MSTVLVPEQENAGQAVVSTQRALAQELGFTPQTVGRWVAEPGFPVVRHSDGSQSFNVEQCRKWVEARRARRVKPGPRDDGVQGDLDDLAERSIRAKLKKEEAAARLQQQKADILEGRYVERAVYEQDLLNLAAVFRKVLSEQPDRIRADRGDLGHEIATEILDVVWAEVQQARDDALEAQGADTESDTSDVRPDSPDVRPDTSDVRPDTGADTESVREDSEEE